MEKVLYYKSFLCKGLKRTFLIMRITAIMLFTTLFQVVAVESYSQAAKVSIRADQVTLTDLFSLIEKQSEFLFFYMNADVANVKVNINVRNKHIQEALGQALSGISLTYTINDRHINIVRRDLAIEQQTRRISGVVHDSGGEPIIGANVIVKGTTTGGTVTDVDGKYSLEVTPNAVLQISYIGYHSKEVVIGTSTTLNIQLIEDTQALEEIVVVGYGTQKRANLTGSVSTVSVAEMGKRQVAQTSLAIQGLVPGVAVTQRSGQPGSDGGIISIRGKTTLGNNDALVLVDGVEMGLNEIDPTLIESISVLKDAASSAIYGSRAANGVILITTKRAEADKFSVSYNGYVGWQNAMNIPDFVNAMDYMTLVNLANENIGKAHQYSDEYLAEYAQGMKTNPDKYPDTRWFDECLTNNGLMQSHFVTLSGGSKRMRTLATVGYVDQNGIIENSNFKRYTFRMNTDMEISPQFTARIDAQATYGNRLEPTRSDHFHWMGRIPSNQAGHLTTGQWGTGWNGDNPIAFTNDGGTRNVLSPSAVLNFTLIYKPKEWLTVQGQYSPNYWESHNKAYNKAIQTYLYDGTPSFKTPQKTTLNDRTDRSLRNLLNGSITFDKTFSSHTVKVMAGYQQDGFRTDWHEGYREVYPFPDYPVLNAGGEENQKATGSAAEYALQSLFGRANYDYLGKYLFEANIRYDGSSRFASGHKWGVFPSFSVGWRLSEESFWTPLKNAVDNFKIRASWGQLGNQNIGNYPFASNVTLSDIKYVFDNSIYSGGALVNMANSLISWETTTVADVGLDITFLGKININADYFYKVTDDILLQLAVPRIIGMNAPQQNAGKVENRGWELGLTYADRMGDFNYRASFNISDVKNKVLDLKGIDETGLTVSRKGYSMYSLYGLEAIGYIQPEDYDDSGTYLGPTQYGNFGPGDIKYKDQLTVDTNDDGIPDAADGVINTSDRVIIGGTIPRYTFGLTLYGEYKGFDLNLFFQGVGKTNGYIYGQGIQTFVEGGSVLEIHKDYWTPENRNAQFPRLAFNENNNIQNSSFWVKNAAYVRLKNLQVGYTIPRRALAKVPISNLRLYFSADNVFTVSDFWKQYDVEAPVGNGSFYPILRNISFGVDLKF
ncbi:TonB-dependent receptor SusC [termite gut metagenome]|uniref:TonB-dependent receptor SusC n=1 Tax=termite gut metagenome TaxID=433724 RepID=A0A5J4RLW9_9ZZZZ